MNKFFACLRPWPDIKSHFVNQDSHLCARYEHQAYKSNDLPKNKQTCIMFLAFTKQNKWNMHYIRSCAISVLATI